MLQQLSLLGLRYPIINYILFLQNFLRKLKNKIKMKEFMHNKYNLKEDVHWNLKKNYLFFKLKE